MEENKKYCVVEPYVMDPTYYKVLSYFATYEAAEKDLLSDFEPHLHIVEADVSRHMTVTRSPRSMSILRMDHCKILR